MVIASPLPGKAPIVTKKSWEVSYEGGCWYNGQHATIRIHLDRESDRMIRLHVNHDEAKDIIRFLTNFVNWDGK